MYMHASQVLQKREAEKNHKHCLYCMDRIFNMTVLNITKNEFILEHYFYWVHYAPISQISKVKEIFL